MIANVGNEHRNDWSRSPRKFFIVGTGRSGTHWLGSVLQSHKDVFALVENRLTFPISTRMALDFSKRQTLLPRLIRRYRIAHMLVRPRHLADKCHPNLWHAEALAEAFPEALFIGIERNPYATVASMLKHQGVRRWHEIWEEYPIPNPFLGITQDNVDEYRQLSIAAKCALRWQAHQERMAALGLELKDRLHVVSYENLIMQTDCELESLNRFLDLRTPLPKPELVKQEALARWRSELSQDMLNDIYNITHIQWETGSGELLKRKACEGETDTEISDTL